MLTVSVNSEITKVTGQMIPCHSPSQNPARPTPSARSFGSCGAGTEQQDEQCRLGGPTGTTTHGGPPSGSVGAAARSGAQGSWSRPGPGADRCRCRVLVRGSPGTVPEGGRCR